MSTTWNHLKVAIREPDVGPVGHCSQDNRDTFPESTTRPGGGYKANRDKDRSADDAGSKSDTVIAKVADFERLAKKAQVAVNEAESVQNLAKILSSERGRESVLNLDREGAGLCIEILDKVRFCPPSTIHRFSLTNAMVQGLAGHKLRTADKKIFLNTLMKLAGKHSRLPSSMMITERNDFSSCSQICASGGFADIRQGRCDGYTVAVKTLRLDGVNPKHVSEVSKNNVFAPIT